MNRKIGLSVMALVLVAGVIGTGTVAAQDNENPQSTLVQKIADKFGLKTEDVQAVFDQEHAERHSRMKAKFEERLSQLVSEGKITEAQKKLIVDKHKEMMAKKLESMENMKNLTPEERRAQMEKHKAEMEAWANEHGIDLQYIMGGFGKHGHGMGKFRMMLKVRPSVTPDQ